VNTRSISFRLTSFYAGLMSCAFVLLAVFTLWNARHFLVSQLQTTLERRARLISENFVPLIGSRGAEFVAHAIQASQLPEATGRFIRVSSADGRIIYLSGAPEDRSFSPEEIKPPREFPNRPESRWFHPEGKAPLVIASAGYLAKDGSKWIVEVGTSAAPIEETLQSLGAALVAGFALAIVLAVAGGWILVRRALRPVEKITRSAEEITFQNTSQRLPVQPTGDELEHLSTALNGMLSRLEDAYQQAKRFSADASHELRTPLSIMRGELEVLAQNRELSTELRDTVGSTLEEVERLSKIVENLLALARLDAGESKAEWAAVDLSELACSTCEQISLLAEDKGVHVNTIANKPVHVFGDRARLKQVVVNLLDNAIKFTPRGGKVDLLTRVEGGNAILEVIDTGIGIPEESLLRIFDRFYRVDRGRSRDLGGAGIGLSIVKSIVQSHNGRVEARSNQPNGVRLVVQLPVLPERKQSPPAKS
jgi:heavy metal sensor kinase